MLRVAMINNFPPDSGTGRRPYSLYWELKKIPEVEVDLICTHVLRETDYQNPLNEGVKFLHKYPYKKNENLSRLLIYFVDPFRVPQGYDLYDIANHMLGIFAFRNQPAIITVHDLLQLKYKEDRGDPISSGIYNLLLRQSLNGIKKAQKVICVSEWTRRQVVEEFGIPQERTVVIYNGVDHKLFKPGDKKEARQRLGLPLDKKILLHVGSEVPRKNVLGIVKAFSMIRNRGSEVRSQNDGEGFILIRIGEKKAVTADLIGDLGLGGKVWHFECVSDEDLVSYYRAADLLVMPSFDEGFGFPLVEAMACGCPVLTSNRGPMPEVVGDAGLLVDPHDIGEITSGIKKVLGSGKLAAEMVEKGMKEAKRFSWSKAAKELAKVYEEII